MRQWFPTPTNISVYLKEWTQPAYAVPDALLEKLFRNDFPTNIDVNHNVVKVQVLNAIYGTSLNATRIMAEHIAKCAIENDLDALIQNGSPEAVNIIAPLSGTKKSKDGKDIYWQRYFISFASKYCSFHNPDAYPMYDSIVKKLLVTFLNEKGHTITAQCFDKNYTLYSEQFYLFRKLYGLEDIPIRSIDKGLWLHGKKQLEKNAHT